MQAIKVAHIQQQTNDSLSGTLNLAEYGYYFIILYTVLGAPLGLILTGGIGSGFLLIPVLALCFVALGPSVLTVLQTAWIPLACGASYLFIQLALHGESLHGRYVYEFGPWLLSLVIVQALAMHRPNFLHRFAWFTLFIGLAMLPFASLNDGGEYERMDLQSGVGYSNSNAMAAWFGFCVLFLTIKGYIETRLSYRLTSWLMAVGCLYVVTLTVSRGALLALAVSLLIAGRRLLKAGLFPVLLLAGLLLGLTELGVFDRAFHAYGIRANEESGRLLVWPLLIEKFLNSPVIGVGASQVSAVVPSGKFVTPHNGFLLFAVASGVMPLMLFCAYIFRSGMAAIRANMSKQPDAAFYLPVVVYAVLIASAGNMDFMTPWAIVSLAVPIADSVSRMNR
jgi:hypothetical protein